jgi:hypothetical protein
MIIRRESPGDAETLRNLFSEVYSDTMFDALHNDPSWMPKLSFVALGEGQEVIGHVAATRGQVGTEDVMALVAPSVDPAHRGRYSLGMRAIEVNTGNSLRPPGDDWDAATPAVDDYYGENITEVGRWIAEDGSNFWGVHVTDVDGIQYILASDRNTGLHIFQFSP